MSDNTGGIVGKFQKSQEHAVNTIKLKLQTICEAELMSYLRLGVVGVLDLGSVVPVAGLLGLWVLDLLLGQHVPVIFQGAGLHLLIVDLHLVCLVWVQDQCVKVGQLVILEIGDGGNCK